MPKKKTNEEFIQEAKLKHNNKFIYDKCNYITASKKVIIICPHHGMFEQKAADHLKGRGCKKCSGREKLTISNFIDRSVIIHNNKYDYKLVRFQFSKEKIKIICPIHGVFEQYCTHHLAGHGCKLCGFEKIKLSQNDFINKCNIIHNNKFSYSKTIYNGHNKVIKIICPIHGQFSQIANGHLNGKGCKKCANDDLLLSNNDFINKSISVHGNKFDYKLVKYKKSNSKIKIICKIHGIFEQLPFNHLRGMGCKKCSIQNQTLSNREFIARCRKIHGNSFNYRKTFYNGWENEIIIICKKHGEFLQKANIHLMGCGCKKCNNSISKIENVWLNYISIPDNFRQKKNYY